MIRKLLIANRGEIACRIARTARAMGVRTVAVHSDADARAAHVAAADEAVRIGPAAASASYLDQDAVLAAVRDSGADALHPGYGFLAENAGFAERCEAAGVCFVGPPPSAIRAMGSKREALDAMAAQGVPVLPGYRGTAQDDDALLAAAAEIGFPLIVKPSAGGGGKGMEVARDAAALARALPAARRVAKAAFGDDTLLLERYLERPRHVEVQVFADAHGGCVHLFERDCSVQRRHQKVVEEAPAPGLPDAVRERMGEVAVAAARAIGYRGAGTVEFLYDPAREDFHFMEMNTRLQVEHPVTEMITGIDLVAWQLRVAAGEPLPLAQDGIRRRGHAIEVRLYAEDPERDFLPASGPVQWFDTPAGDGHVRVDAGVRAGDAVSVHYDPMIAKLVAWGTDRSQAAARLGRALAQTAVGPLASNLSFLRTLAGHPAWLAGDLDTGFLARHAAELGAPRMDARDALAGAAAYLLAAEPEARASPWERLRGFRLNLPACTRLRLELGGEVHDLVVEPRRDDTLLHLPGDPVALASIERVDDGGLAFRADGHTRRVHVRHDGDVLHLDDGRARAAVTRLPPATPAGGGQVHGAGRLVAPMPGRVVSLTVAAGDRVSAGQPLVVLEAMKMEHTLAAPGDGHVESVGCSSGAQVDEGAVLVVLELD